MKRDEILIKAVRQARGNVTSLRAQHCALRLETRWRIRNMAVAIMLKTLIFVHCDTNFFSLFLWISLTI